ncbi:DUF3488 and transglutaminase-like domain-containing protein [Psychrobium sp. 1_MG-2023]|uniref:transglutaminase family protein n=1 Tax=Psychrobium sp. 1_MG-2023 TaxID=3062624 RepID=UPI000C33FBC6|nr:DUF3488 and transglutaminase-like domain-containing protein [Psychrobium sp. 1_MG-2023]MDP2561091.1 DUF3488 and transglutaminase-like domain-containing protein [Psychrobium sp. 1_MG-2023]PKF58380.1 hypothetical protein CW748_04255 [Alteromonadales bacterium alter-6D02]
MNKSWLANQYSIVLMIFIHSFSLLLLWQEAAWWVAIISIGTISWRWLYFKGQVLKVNRWWHFSIVLSCIILLTITGPSHGLLLTMVNLLLVGFALKFIELYQQRDAFILALISILTAGVALVFGSEIKHAIFNLILLIATLCLLINICAPALKWRQQLTLSTKIFSVSLPLTAVLFLLMPQLSPLWQMPSIKQATTGLSDNMSPGDIASLTQSSELAFSVTFDGERPLPQELYWRALVMESFDGRRWSQSPVSKLWQRSLANNTLTEISPTMKSFNYQIIAKPSNQQWLFGLALPLSNDNGVRQSFDGTLFATKPVVTPMQYTVSSVQGLMTLAPINNRSRLRNLALPEQTNLKTQQWVAELRQRHEHPQALINAVLAYFRQQPFYYTLTPKLLGQDSIDDFLFNTREGFCAHYASAFSFVMRSAGIPSRVVAGYQGGEWNDEVGYLNVYQYDAHAWNEVWLDGQGWVRVDPTAQVSPERVTQGLVSTLGAEQDFLSGSVLSLARYQHSPWVNQLRVSLANIEYLWSRWLLGYDKEAQNDLLEYLLGEVNATKIMVLILICLCVIALWLAWFSGFRLQRKTYQQKSDELFNTVVAKLGVKRPTHLPAYSYLQQVAQQRPHIKREIALFSCCFNQIQYQQCAEITRQDWLKLKQAAKELFDKI